MELKTVAIILITLGAVVLFYSGITYETKKPHEVLGVHFETTERHFIPPVTGALMLVGGIALVAMNRNKV